MIQYTYHIAVTAYTIQAQATYTVAHGIWTLWHIAYGNRHMAHAHTHTHAHGSWHSAQCHVLCKCHAYVYCGICTET